MDDFWSQTSPVCENVPGNELHFAYNPTHAQPSYMPGLHPSAFSMVQQANGGTGVSNGRPANTVPISGASNARC